MGGSDEIAAMDRDLPESTILLFRRLAHAKVGVGCKQLSYRRLHGLGPPQARLLLRLCAAVCFCT